MIVKQADVPNVTVGKQYSCGFYFQTVTGSAQSIGFRVQLAGGDVPTSITGPDANGWSLLTATTLLTTKSSSTFAALIDFTTSNNGNTMQAYVDDAFCNIVG
jgi:hypothetical protein